MCKGISRYKILFPATVLIILVLSISALAQSAPKRVLVVYWYDKDYPWNVMFDQTFQARLKSTSYQTVEYHAEYFETNRFPQEQLSPLLHDYLRQKYANQHPDVLVATSDITLDFLLKYRNDLFPQTPIVFIATKPPDTKDPGITGIISINNYLKTLELALKLHPQTEQVYIVSGTLDHDGRIEKLARADIQGYQGQASINFLTDIPPDGLVNKIQNLSNRSLVLYVWQQSKSADGKVIESMDILRKIAQSAQVPIYKLSTLSYVGPGIVGGYINTPEANAKRVAEIVLRIAGGTRAADIPIEDAPTELQFDWPSLQRWGISESQLPPGSIIRFREVTFWEQYKGRIIGVLTIIGVEALLIAGLLFERAKRWRATRELAELTGRLLRTQDDERRHIARELHDVTAQGIGVIMLNLAQVQNTVTALDSKSGDRVAESLTLGEQALKEIRTLSYVLHPPLLDQAGLITALKWYVKGFTERSGVKVVFTENGNNGDRMPSEVEYALFRVVQECLTNIRRHSNSETAEIDLTRTHDELALVVRDHGEGQRVEASRNGDGIENLGVGIPGMRHRLRQLGGELLVETGASGTTVTATVPVNGTAPTIEH